MSEIPEDVRKAARSVWRENWKLPAVEQIEMAIMAERDRAAKVAEAFYDSAEDALRDAEDVHLVAATKLIAVAIRRGSP